MKHANLFAAVLVGAPALAEAGCWSNEADKAVAGIGQEESEASLFSPFAPVYILKNQRP